MDILKEVVREIYNLSIDKNKKSMSLEDRIDRKIINNYSNATDLYQIINTTKNEYINENKNLLDIVNYSSQDKYTNLNKDKIIKDSYQNDILKNHNNKIDYSNIIDITKKKDINYILKSPNLDDLAGLNEDLLKRGFTLTIETISTAGDIPHEYESMYAVLGAKHSGLEFVSLDRLEDKSQHNVDILTFKYIQEGKEIFLQVVTKDKDTKEHLLPEFLNSIGVKTHSVDYSGQKMMIDFVGKEDLRDIVKSASENDIRNAYKKAVEKIAIIHELGTLHLPDLKNVFGINLELTNYMVELSKRFTRPIGSAIVSVEEDRFVNSYHRFSQLFNQNSLIHGDYHTGNCRISPNECFIVDYEWAKVGQDVDDLARFINSIHRDKPTMDYDGLVGDVLDIYVSSINGNKDDINKRLNYALINDEIMKTGEYVEFAQKHPKVAKEKLKKSATCFIKSIYLIDKSLSKCKDNSEYNTLAMLKHDFINYCSISKIKELSDAATEYQKIEYRIAA